MGLVVFIAIILMLISFILVCMFWSDREPAIREPRNRKDDFERLNEKHHSELTSLRDEKLKLQGELISSRDENAKLQGSLNSSRNEKEKLEAELIDVRDENTTLQDSLNLMRTQNDDKLRDVQNEISEIREEMYAANRKANETLIEYQTARNNMDMEFSSIVDEQTLREAKNRYNENLFNSKQVKENLAQKYQNSIEKLQLMCDRYRVLLPDNGDDSLPDEISVLLNNFDKEKTDFEKNADHVQNEIRDLKRRYQERVRRIRHMEAYKEEGI